MAVFNPRFKAKELAAERTHKIVRRPQGPNGEALTIPEYFGIHVFDIEKSDMIPAAAKEQLAQVRATENMHLSKELADIVAKAVTEWATRRGATHFCHWFQPLTGATAEKHDAFLDFDKNKQPIMKLSASQLMQGEPDASSFPHGGRRSTFEARGYTAWDMSSPLFLVETGSGLTLSIPTAFFSYTAEAMDVKTPLLRSISALSKHATEFLNLIGDKDVVHVNTTCGAEQEYFLVDKAFYYSRPDLVMTGRMLFGKKTSRNQQLSDHYFGTIPERVEAFMQELEVELYKLGIPAKTRHNEVAPGQFELAPIFSDANVAADQNQLVMSTMKKVALRHDFVALLHEKPFPGINGSGKHLNWSMSDSQGNNLLNPGDNPHQNHRFLATLAIVCEAVHRHAKLLRTSISDAGNDHRLGAHEAPPSIISVFLGDTLNGIFESIREGATFVPSDQQHLDIGTRQLVQLLKDNTDRNRTSPFAFTGNKFEFRACGSSKSVGLPLSMLNAAVADIFEQSNQLIADDLKAGKSVAEALTDLTRHWINSSKEVVFNGDGYSSEWVQTAEKRGLPNLKTTPDALQVLTDAKITSHLVRLGIYTEKEVEARFNVLTERYNSLRHIEAGSLTDLVRQHVLPSAFSYKQELVTLVQTQKEIGTEGTEKEHLVALSQSINNLSKELKALEELAAKYEALPEVEASMKLAHEVLPKMEQVADYCNELEQVIPDHLWTLPTAYDMLFVR
ncbi:MAG: glutamine synthetase III [Bdellovibrionales bacterium]|nr:glutamine synthetase III [Bdellovibrionales bacterium]